MENVSVINGKVYTDACLLDEVVHNCKIMVRDIILKDENEALMNETLDSLREADVYMAIMNGNARFESFKYKRDIIDRLPGISKKQAEDWTVDNSLIPDYFKATLLKWASEDFLENFEERNNYYRKLAGIPIYGDDPILLERKYFPKGYEKYFEYYENTPVHKLPNTYVELLLSFDIIKKMKADNPKNSEYLDFIGDKRISVYDARSTPKFGILYLAKSESNTVYVQFRDNVEKNRRLMFEQIYQDAYKVGSDNYDKFMMIMIILQAFVDTVMEIPGYIIRRDIFDIRTVQYIFESHGVEYFPEIPMKYQIALINNLNKLIKFKATDKILIHICSLFGFDDVKIFKYYLMKDHIVDAKKQYKFHVPTTLNPDDLTLDVDSNLDAEYELKFIKVPMGEYYDDYIRDPINTEAYDAVIMQDDYWNGDKTYEYVKRQVLEHDFTILRSKYISIQTIYRISEVSFQMCYFLNILFDSAIDKNLLRCQIPYINSTASFKLLDIFVLLYALGMAYANAEDVIIDRTDEVVAIKGFNLHADMEKISNYVMERGYTLSQLGVSDFMIPENDVILSYNQLMDIYLTNKKVHDHIVHEIVNAESKEIYDIYQYLYDALMVTYINMEYYRLPNGEMAKTYTEFLKHKDRLLYNFLEALKDEQDMEVRQSNIATAINYIITYMDEYIDVDELPYIFSNIPSVSMDYIKIYIKLVVEFFKSFKLHLLNINTVYLFDDKFENTIFMIDKIWLHYFYEKFDKVDILDKIKDLHVDMTKHTHYENLERIYLNIHRWIESHYDDLMDIFEGINEMWNTIEYTDEEILELKYALLISTMYTTKVNVIDLYWRIYTFAKDDHIPMEDLINILVSLIKVDKVHCYDIFFGYSHTFAQDFYYKLVYSTDKLQTRTCHEHMPVKDRVYFERVNGDGEHYNNDYYEEGGYSSYE